MYVCMYTRLHVIECNLYKVWSRNIFLIMGIDLFVIQKPLKVIVGK